MEISGAKMFVKALEEEGIKEIFAYPGGQAIDLFDALYNSSIELILPRHEQALVHAADGYARSTGNVGVCLVTSGPGATNLVTGIATANFDSVPLVCFTGQVATPLIGNDAFQEVDIVGICRNICKYAVTVRKREDLATIIRKAFIIAKSGKPGPVLVDIPKDVQLALGSDNYEKNIEIRGYKPYDGIHLGQIRRASALLKESKKPVLLLGGGVNIARAYKEVKEFVELTKIPVVTTIMGKGSLSTDHPYYIGNVGMHGIYAANKAIQECDVLLSIGCRFNDRITGKVSEFAKNAKIIHIDIDPASISRNIVVDIPIVGDAKTALQSLLDVSTELDTRDWIKYLMDIKVKHPISMKKYSGLTPEAVIKLINENYNKLILSTDVGQNQLWTTQYLDLNENKKLLTSGGLGTMGYGLPAAIGAKIGNPDTPVVSISGDGGFQMNLQELATLKATGLPVTIIIFNNEYLGNVRQWQEMFYDKRYASTCLRKNYECNNDCKNCKIKYRPDFVKMAEAYDIKAKRIFTLEEANDAIKEASQSNESVLLEIIIERELNVYPMTPGGRVLNDMVLDC